MFAVAVLFRIIVAEQCSSLQRCYGKECSGFLTQMTSITNGDTPSEDDGRCAPRITPVFVALGAICDPTETQQTQNRVCPPDADASETTDCCAADDITCLCDVQSNPLYELGTIERDNLQTPGLIFRKMIEVTTHEELNADNTGSPLYMQNYIKPPITARLHSMGYDKARCAQEVCIPAPCVFLDMNFAGATLLSAYEEADLSDEAADDGDDQGDDKLDDKTYIPTDMSSQLWSRRCRDDNGPYLRKGCVPPSRFVEDTTKLKAKEFSMVDVSTYCGPIFGTRAVVGGKNVPSKVGMQKYEGDFPTQTPVSTSYKAGSTMYGPSGVIIPSKGGKFIPDHYFTDGKDGRLASGTLLTDAASCDDRSSPNWQLPRLCARNRYSQCLPWGWSGNYRAGCPHFTMMDPMVFNGVFAGFYHGRNNAAFAQYSDSWDYARAVGWVEWNGDNKDWKTDQCDSLKHHKFYLQTPEMFFDNTGPSTVVDSTPESIANRLVLTTKWGIGSYSLHGFLNDPHAWITPNTKPTSFEGPVGKHYYTDNQHKYYKWQHQLYDEEGHKTDDSSERWNEQINNVGFTFYEDDVDEWHKSTPGQTLDPTNKYNEEVAADLDRPIVPAFLRGKFYSKTIMFMNTLEGMSYTNGQDIEYYHPYFRPILKNADGLTDDTSCVAYHNSQINPQGERGYCYITNARTVAWNSNVQYALSIVGMIRVYHLYKRQHWLRTVYNQDDTEPLHFCKQDVTDICEPTTNDILELAWFDAHRHNINPATVNFNMEGRNAYIILENNGKFKESYSPAKHSTCDFNFCDIAQTYSLTFPGSYDCVSRGDTAIETRGSTWKIITQSPQDISDGAETEKAFVKFWYNSAMVIHRTTKSWQRGCTGDECDVFSNGGVEFRGVRDDPSKSGFVRWMILHVRQHTKHTNKETISYYDAISADPQVEGVTFFPTERDAGYSQQSSIPEENTCNCDHQPIEYLCSMTVDEGISTHYEYSEEFAHKLFVAGRLQLGVCSYSWKYSARGPDIGLYMPSTKRDIVITERDLVRLDHKSTQDRHEQLEKMLLGKHAPDPTVTEEMLIFSEDHVTRYMSGMSVHQTSFKYSCMRYPYGLLHRSQMTANAAFELYGGANENREITFESLQGYCEKVYSGTEDTSQYRHCPNARHTVEQRKQFCEGPDTNFMANHMIYGYHASDITAESSCDDREGVKVCLVVPGSAFLAGDIKTYTTQGTGSGGPGYTLLVAPFNATFLRRYILRPKALPMFASKEHPYVMPDYTDGQQLVDVEDDQMKTTFGYHPDTIENMLYLAADVRLTLEHYRMKTTNAAVEFITQTVTEFVDHIFADVNDYNDDTGQWAAPCADVPDHTGDETKVKVCVKPEEILLPNTEVMIPIEYDGITLQSAYQALPEDIDDDALFEEKPTEHLVYPVLFKGLPDGAVTCERILSGSNHLTLHVAIGNTPECNNFDEYRKTPVKLTGVSTAGSVIAVDVRDYDTAVAVSVLGSDFEMFNVPAELEVSDTFITVARKEESNKNFDVALARVVHPKQKGIDLKVFCMHGTNEYTDKAKKYWTMKALGRYAKPAITGCRLLEMGAMHKPLVIHPYVGRTGMWDPFPTVEYTDSSYYECVEGLPWHQGSARDPHMCTYVNITKFTGIFGIGVEDLIVEMPQHHATTVTIILVMLSIYTVGLFLLNVALWYDSSHETMVDAGIASLVQSELPDASTEDDGATKEN